MSPTATDQHQPYFYPPTIPEHQRSHVNSRRSSAATISNNQNRSSRSLRDRRRSSGAISIHSQQKPKKCIGDYVVGKTLGKGASGRVKLGVHRLTGEQVAIKIISKAHLAANPAIEKAVRREIAIMKLIHHPNVMSLIDVIDDPTSSDLYLILEYVEGGELFEYLVGKGRLGEAEARHHFQQIILGLDYCHHHLICHRDLKPENLLLDSRNNIKIADFGMASLQPLGSMLETSCGSPHYASPEIVAGMPYHGSACDIWSCGVILYALLTGHLPFDDENIRQLLKKVKAGKYIMPENISASAQDLIRRILVVDPSRRLNMQQIMAHPWFRETEPYNINVLPIPPTEKEIGQPVSDASEIDDRILETIKFLWGETSDDTVINALVQKEHNMQKVIYVLLQQHAERYWQAEHGDESDDDLDDNYSDRRRYRTIGRERKSLTLPENNHMIANGIATTRKAPSPPNRPTSPWMDQQKNEVLRRYSAATLRSQRAPVPSVELKEETQSQEKQMKKSETFYTKFVKNVLSPSRRQSSKETRSSTEPSPSTDTTTPPKTPIAATLVGTLRRKNPFNRAPINTTDFAISPASMREEKVRPPSHIQKNKVDPVDQDNNTKKTISNKAATLRLSLRIPNAFKNDAGTVTKKFGFTLGSNNHKQRKQLDLSIFQNEQVKSPTSPPPELSDASSICSSQASSPIKTPTYLKNGNRRTSQVSFKSIDRRPSNFSTSTLQHYNRPITPSLLSNSSFAQTSANQSQPQLQQQQQQQQFEKSSWLNNLFIFKQPKICSLVVYSTHTAGILRSLHRLMNITTEARFYEKTDRTGVTRYKAEIKTKGQDGAKSRQVKCRIELIMSEIDRQSCVVQFTQQQGDGVLLHTTIQQLHGAMLKEFPCPSNIVFSSDPSYKEMHTVITSGTLVEDY